MAVTTPMMQQYQRIKDEHPDKILFFRLGDFYEMFGHDAELAARELEITLTSRETGKGNRVPMAGIPCHAAEPYIARLIEGGHKIAVCEQVEDAAGAKGLVRREVVRVITPGTVSDPRLLEEKNNNFLVCVAELDGKFGLAAADVSTGEFCVTQLDGRYELAEELLRFQPRECLLPTSLADNVEIAGLLRDSLHATVTERPRWEFQRDSARRVLMEHFGTASLHGYGCEELPAAISAAGALLSYLRETQKSGLSHITGLTTFAARTHMVLDAAARRNLELTRRIIGSSRQGTVLAVLDQTLTAMGGRLLRQWLESPLADAERIKTRLDAVEELVEKAFVRADLRTALRGICDLERLMARVATGNATPRDMAALRSSLLLLPRLQEILAGVSSTGLRAVYDTLTAAGPKHEAIADSIGRALVDDPPPTLAEGGVIRDGYDARVDELRLAAGDGRSWIARLESLERERTGIKSLKVGFNKVFGYYIEVTRPNLHLVPPSYTRKQTLANAERYITEELKEKEALVLGAHDRVVALEQELFSRLREEVARQVTGVQEAARVLAELDVLSTLAEVAVRNGYVKPEVTEGDTILIRQGRHPVLEQTLPAGTFVPNDCLLDGRDHRLLIITGPNMAGKSTYLRQVALIVLLAQMGSFVPAASAEIGVVDRIFTRVGAADDLATGRSTFMVEMTEVANVIHNATHRSLVIMDEVGRGTSTFDGLSIAWAISEYVHNSRRLGARTLFATHYHELTVLEKLLPGAKNYSVAVREKGDQVVFLYKIVRGGSDRSYGLHVARLAGIPPAIVERARDVLRRIENGDWPVKHTPGREGEATPAAAADAVRYRQASWFDGQSHPVLEELKNLNLFNMTPLEALNLLYQLQARVRRGD